MSKSQNLAKKDEAYNAVKYQGMIIYAAAKQFGVNYKSLRQKISGALRLDAYQGRKISLDLTV